MNAMNALPEFYQSPIGRMAQDFLLARLRKLLTRGGANGRTLIIGYGLPFASDIAEVTGGQVFLAYLDGMAAAPWPSVDAHHCCIATTDALPFSDVTFDQVMLVHALELAPDPLQLMHEVQRVLAAEGKVICIVPNRRGLWSWFEHTPFGEGQTFSCSQMRRLLISVELSPLQVGAALFAPPLDFSCHELTRAIARAIEAIGNHLSIHIGGAVVATAQKQRYAGTGTKVRTPRARVRMQWAAAPAAARAKTI